jgi:hypothetical protein
MAIFGWRRWADTSLPTRRRGNVTSPARRAVEKMMTKSCLKFAFAALAAVALASCGGNKTPGDAAGAKVMRNLLDKSGVNAKLVSFKTVQGREVKNAGGEAYELMFEAEVQFPQPKANEVHKSEGTLHFVKTEKGWLAEDNAAY